MTSPRSSISSSDARRYLRALGIALGALVGALVMVTATGYALGLVEAANHDLYTYQRDKLASPNPIDIVFVGDSSLGNAIDAEQFSAASGYRTLNLALNGSYGSGGAYNMLRKTLVHHTPRLAVVMLSIDTMRRDDAFPGYYFSAEPRQLLTMSPVRILELYFSLKTAKRVLETLWKHGLTEAKSSFEGDYISQGHPIGAAAASEVEANPLLPDRVAPAQLEYIERIAKLCTAHDVACVYAHGPIFAGYCRQAARYIAALSAGIRAAGLDIVAGTPLCLPENALGDSIDHVRHDLEDVYTRRYAKLLRETPQSGTVMGEVAPRIHSRGGPQSLR